MLKQQLQQKLQQKLSPQQIQLIRLIELPAIELEERVKHELEENPALEEGKSDEPSDSYDMSDDNAEPMEGGGDEASISDDGNDSDADADLSLGDYMTADDIPEYKLREMNDRAEKKEDIPFSAGESLGEFLLEQLGLRDNLSERQRKIAEYIIGNIDDDGYLRRDLSSISDDLMFQTGEEVTEDEIESILKVVQDFEPNGVGARSLKECLLIQLKKLPQTLKSKKIVKNAEKIIDEYYDDFIRKRYERIMRSMGIDEEAFKIALKEITKLNPKPGNGWDGSMDLAFNSVTPDFIVDANNGELTLTMNDRGIPDLHVNTSYADMFKDYTSNKNNQTKDMRDAVQFVKQKLDSAQWFIDAIRQRQDTLRRTMEAIIVMQKEFFLTGDESTLHPMILKDVAERAGYDISTISRVSNSKYVQSNFGIYPLKYFFSESIQKDTGEEISTREVKKIIKDHVDNEDKRNPLTDEELDNILKENGYIIARRTVAKYRKQLSIPVARLRKEL